jgi:hypothetical protein
MQCSPLTLLYDLTFRFCDRELEVIAINRLRPKKQLSISMSRNTVQPNDNNPTDDFNPQVGKRVKKQATKEAME